VLPLHYLPNAKIRAQKDAQNPHFEDFGKIWKALEKYGKRKEETNRLPPVFML
jgi:hypothetical protein